jgi:hypothetical protein
MEKVTPEQAQKPKWSVVLRLMRGEDLRDGFAFTGGKKPLTQGARIGAQRSHARMHEDNDTPHTRGAPSSALIFQTTRYLFWRARKSCPPARPPQLKRCRVSGFRPVLLLVGETCWREPLEEKFAPSRGWGCSFFGLLEVATMSAVVLPRLSAAELHWNGTVPPPLVRRTGGCAGPSQIASGSQVTPRWRASAFEAAQVRLVGMGEAGTPGWPCSTSSF